MRAIGVHAGHRTGRQATTRQRKCKHIQKRQHVSTIVAPIPNGIVRRLSLISMLRAMTEAIFGAPAKRSKMSEWIVKPAAVIISTDCSKKAAKPDDCNLVMYHGTGCPDGFAAAFAAWKRLGDKAQYVAMEHGPSAKYPEAAGKHAVFVDYCPNRQIADKMKSEAASFIVLDHHASAQKELDGFSSDHQVFEMKQVRIDGSIPSEPLADAEVAAKHVTEPHWHRCAFNCRAVPLWRGIISIPGRKFPCCFDTLRIRSV